ncbi:hypothetical protein AB1A81_03115 [Bdellovibrio bacteriovorus]|uniref:Uncharacterized protein n=1 Tax=Bdellovibrio bacteriovorus (strain ATCC 15356 / DSM 50701 / NCIMB 9529 / HD100) TaxID=264462 RepID=Q6MQ07_BDEBA|nr:hypothetical protein [Bdellovibrio bacteriovorus]CAE78640.1 hypothetical protein predicted by Glimmer/Critica [Bdellovibrio bacteriovorus HD100]
MKQAFCALMILGLASTSFAAKPYYTCSLNYAGNSVQADSEVLIQFKNGKVAVKGTGTTGTCFGDVKFMGSEGHYAAYFEHDGRTNTNCTTYNNIQWLSTSEGYASISPNATVDLADVRIGGIWARYTCK